MIRRHVLAALAAGIDAKDEDVARASLRRVELVVRAVARRHLERRLIDAALECQPTGIADPVHVLYLAALATADASVSDPGDQTSVAAAYARLPRVAMPRVPLWSIAVASMVAAIALAITWYVAALPPSHGRTYARPLPPPSVTAFNTGGVPLADPAIDKLLGDQVTRLVVAAGTARDRHVQDLEPILRPLREPAVIVARGAQLRHAWQTMVTTFGQAIASSQAGEQTVRSADQLREAVREVSADFAELGLGYFLEGRFKNGYPFIQAYRVEEIVFVVAAGAPRRVLSLRRLDHLNTSYALLGMQSEDIGDPVLLLDQIDENVASTVFPVLAADAPYPLAEHDWLATEPGTSLALTVGRAVRGEIAAALGADANAAAQIAKLLIERGDLIDQWRDTLERKHMRMVRTSDLFVPDGLLDELENVVPTYQRRRVTAIEDELVVLDAARIASRVHELIAATVRRHEAQHGFDDARDTELRYPQPLADLLGSPHDGEGNEVPIVRSARAELSAYLSQVANDPTAPQIALWNLGRQLFSRDRWGTGESYVGVVVFEGLARHLGVTVEGTGLRRGIDRDRFAKLAQTIVAQPGAQLRAAASALWLELYGEPVTTIVDAVRPSAPAARS